MLTYATDITTPTIPSARQLLVPLTLARRLNLQDVPHTSAYVIIRQRGGGADTWRQHTSAYVNIRLHLAAEALTRTRLNPREPCHTSSVAFG
jgi:hypothetical protein